MYSRPSTLLRGGKCGEEGSTGRSLGGLWEEDTPIQGSGGRDMRIPEGPSRGAPSTQSRTKLGVRAHACSVTRDAVCSGGGVPFPSPPRPFLSPPLPPICHISLTTSASSSHPHLLPSFSPPPFPPGVWRLGPGGHSREVPHFWQTPCPCSAQHTGPFLPEGPTGAAVSFPSPVSFPSRFLQGATAPQCQTPS